MAVAEATYDPPTTQLDENGQGEPYAVFGFGAQLTELEVDLELGTVELLKVTAAHDVGRPSIPPCWKDRSKAESHRESDWP